MGIKIFCLLVVFTLLGCDQRSMMKNMTSSEGEVDQYQVVASGVVKDRVTNLLWMRCSLGQTWNGTTCQGQAQRFLFEDTSRVAQELNLKGGVGGYGNWRIPRIDELYTLIVCERGFVGSVEIPDRSGRVKEMPDMCKDQDQGSVTLNERAFPNTPSSGFGYWTSTLNDGDTYRFAYRVQFWNGHVDSYGPLTHGVNPNIGYSYLRLVHDGEHRKAHH